MSKEFPDHATREAEALAELAEAMEGGAALEGETVIRRLVDIAALRARHDMTQQEFADALGISVGTLRNWEQGRRKPEGPARRLLALLEDNVLLARQVTQVRRTHTTARPTVLIGAKEITKSIEAEISFEEGAVWKFESAIQTLAAFSRGLILKPSLVIIDAGLVLEDTPELVEILLEACETAKIAVINVPGLETTIQRLPHDERVLIVRLGDDSRWSSGISQTGLKLV